MGWSYIDRMPAEGPKAFLDGMFKPGAVVKSAMVGRTYFAAVRRADGVVGAVVGLIEGRFGWKMMGEEEGPYHDGSCPAEILAELPPTKEPFALKWRARQENAS